MTNNRPTSRPPAHAPYNFVPLPDKEALAGELLDRHDRFYPKRFSGRFDVELRTVTPLYIRGMWTAAELEAQKKVDKKEDIRDFFMVDGKPCIPGSSLRGMLRSMLEIITFGKIQPISDRQGFSFRAVAAQKNDPLAEPYKTVIGSFGRNVRAGYLHQEGERWFVKPAQRFGSKNEAYAKVKDTLKNGSSPVTGVKNMIRLNDEKYKVQYHDVDFIFSGDMITAVTTTTNVQKPQGVLVCTGNMAETAQARNGRVITPRRNYALVLAPDPKAKPLTIPKQVIADYLTALTPFQKEADLHPEFGVLKHGRPIFYIAENDEVLRFGHSPNFRIAHLVRSGKVIRAVTTHDLVPAGLQDERGPDLDYAETMFGYVREGSDRVEASAYSSRVNVTSAKLMGNTVDAFEPEAFIPKILSSPKPTTFQHYLEQRPNGVNTPMSNLEHWGTRDGRIRGHKLYWRKRITSIEAVRETEEVVAGDSQHTTMRPIKKHQHFRFQVYFENLTATELGALEWVLTLGRDPQAYHMLGMGKPYGMGVIKLEAQLTLHDRVVRYASLFDNEGDWATGSIPTQQNFIAAFKAMIIEKTGKAFDDHRRIRELKTMLKLVAPNVNLNYMTIEPNQFKDRPVLPYPSEVKTTTVEDV